MLEVTKIGYSFKIDILLRPTFGDVTVNINISYSYCQAEKEGQNSQHQNEQEDMEVTRTMLWTIGTPNAGNKFVGVGGGMCFLWPQTWDMVDFETPPHHHIHTYIEVPLSNEQTCLWEIEPTTNSKLGGGHTSRWRPAMRQLTYVTCPYLPPPLMNPPPHSTPSNVPLNFTMCVPCKPPLP